jgi:transcriptional regulator with GAF, ATPase, and Fis domain
MEVGKMAKKYSEYIMRDLREHRDLEKDDTSKDEEIMKMSENEAFEEVLNWNGIIGYSHSIKNWIEEIYQVDLSK